MSCGASVHSLLLVEDDLQTRDSLARLLGLDGWQVAVADDGAHGLTLLKEGLRPAIIVTDYLMPRLDDLAMLNRIRADDTLPTPPAVLISASNLAPQVYADKADAYLGKPLDLKHLRRTLSNLVDPTSC